MEDQPDGALPLATSEVHVRILNATGRDGTVGIAAANRTVLAARGFTIDSVGNYATQLQSSELRFGDQGIVAAYTLAAHFPEMRMVLDTREDATVDLLVGTAFDRPLDEDKVPTGPLKNLKGCVPADEITHVPGPSPSPTEEQPAEG